MQASIKETGSGQWYRREAQDEDDHEGAYPEEQPHFSTNEHDEHWNEYICSVGIVG